MILRGLCTVSRIYVYLSLIRGKVSRQVDVLVYEYRTGEYYMYLLPPSKIRREVLEGSTSLCSIAYAR